MKENIETTRADEQDTEQDPLAGLRAELAREEAALGHLERERAKQVEARDLKRRLEAMKREKALAAALPELEAKYGALGERLARVDTDDMIIVVRGAEKLKYRKFLDETKGGSEIKTDRLRDLARPCVVFPSIEEVDAVLEESPGVLVEIANAVTDVTRRRAKAASGK